MIKRMPFKRPTTHYDERIKDIDEQICKLIRERKELSNNNPGFPQLEYISGWAEKFGLYEELLQSLFGTLLHEELLRPWVEPEDFRMNIPVLKASETDKCFFSVPFIRQYSNCSVVNFNVDWEAAKESPEKQRPYRRFELCLGPAYDCRMAGGGGTGEHYSYNFVVTPALPDDPSGLDLVFKEFNELSMSDLTGFEVTIHLE